MRYVIVGGGVAGIHCIEGIRSLDREGEIVLISEEERSNYGRPLISYYLEGATDLAHISYRGEDFYARNAVRALHSVRAEHLDPQKKQLTLSDGERLSYDKLCVCTGAAPFVPDFKGLESVENKFTFMTLGDAQALKQAVSPESRVLIVGAGLIGLKAAEGLYGRVKDVTVCDLAPHVLSSVLRPESAALVEDHLRSKGIRLLMGDSVQQFNGHSAILNSGLTVEFEVLVLAVGVRSNAALIREAGGQVERGILTDRQLATSLPDVYAAGDCVGPYLILPQAARQGRCAGINMAGGDAVMEQGIPMNSLGLLGMHVMSAGSYEGEEITEKTETGLRQFFVKDGLLVGFILVGGVERAGVYTSLIREKRPIDSFDFAAVRRTPSLLALGKETRVQKLGGAV